MPGLRKPVLHARIIEALGDAVEDHGPVDQVPFTLRAEGLLAMAVFAFTVTDPPGGRDVDELKIQLIVPGQGRRERGTLTHDDQATFLILLGYSPHYDVFVLWDAYRHRQFAYSKNCQVRLATMTDARLTGLGSQPRTLGDGQVETILAARPDHLHQALARRIQIG